MTFERILVLSVNPNTISVAAGNTATATIRGGIAPYSIKASDWGSYTPVSTASVNGSTITITASNIGSNAFTVTDKNNSKATITVKVPSVSNTITVPVGKTVTLYTGGLGWFFASEPEMAPVAEASINGEAHILTIRGFNKGTGRFAVYMSNADALLYITVIVI